MLNAYFSPRWVKMLRDFWIAKGRVAMMVLAIAAGVFAVTTILTAYTILTREVSRNYLSTHPASASLELDNVSTVAFTQLLDAVRQQPGIAAAEARATLRARIEVKKDVWLPTTLFVVQDFKAMQVSRFTPESGAASPPDGSMLLEREALKLINANIGDQMTLKTKDAQQHSVLISGVVHDPSLAPAWQEQTAYAYITPATYKQLSGIEQLSTLKVAIQDQAGQLSYDQATIERNVAHLATWLTQQGYKVTSIAIPPPGQHPHQGQMSGVLRILLAFSIVASLLGAILTATMISAMLAQQVRQIGVMKAIGARSWPIARLYVVFILVVGSLASAIGLPSGLAAGQSLSYVGSQLFNINIESVAIPIWAYLVALSCGVLVPILVALGPIFKSTSITVRVAIDDFGARRASQRTNCLDRGLSRCPGLDRSFVMTVRNIFRRPGRLLMTLLLLSSAGALLISTLSIQRGWEENLVTAAKDRHYDIETILNHPAPEASTLALIAAVPGVQVAESWKEQAASSARPDGWLMERTYPDGGHGSLSLITVPDRSQLIALRMLSGHWLRAQELDTVVLNNAASNYFGNPPVGSTITVIAGGTSVQLRVAGIAREILTGSHLYISQQSHEHLFGQSGTSTHFRIALKKHDAESIKTTTTKIEAKLEKEQIATHSSITETMLGTALDSHTKVLIVILLLMALVMAGVGALGLASAMGTNVIERTREFGIMRTIGGRSSIILRNLLGEAVLIGVMSWVLAVFLSLPLAMGLGLMNKGMNAGLSLPILFSPEAALLCLGGMIVVAIVASAIPARTAAQLSIRDTLVFV